MAPRGGQERPRPDFIAQHRLPPYSDEVQSAQPSVGPSKSNVTKRQHLRPASRPSTVEPTAKCALVSHFIWSRVGLDMQHLRPEHSGVVPTRAAASDRSANPDLPCVESRSAARRSASQVRPSSRPCNFRRQMTRLLKLWLARGVRQIPRSVTQMPACLRACLAGMGPSTCQGISTFSWAEPSRPNESCPQQDSRRNSASCHGVCALPVRPRTHDLLSLEG
ncbi:hypothetical protein CCMA1212_006556 [Trichoderma ghanense]|uniref:Uncharacterized protein n=1 Tax=Trichoderma ghanense TaxID=65468 RepID=A0ABY2H022_9HYPO